MSNKVNAVDISKIEDRTFETDDTTEVPPNDIIAYNELRSCADLYRMHDQKVLDLSPDFQRDTVWQPAAKSRFIDSLIKGLPIPSMCFAYDQKKNKWIVIDGLQRISTIVKFLDGGDWNISNLDDIEPEISGQSVSKIKDEKSKLHKYYSRVENLSIPVTVLRCDFTKKNHMEYMFTIFHRLNTGGLKLNNQEIRNCIYSGSFNKLLHDLDKNSSWRKINKMSPGNNYRFKKQEIILRFFAFHDAYDIYEGGLAKFLNTYMHKHRNSDQTFLENKKEIFERTTSVIHNKLLPTPAPKLSVSVLEALLVGIGRNIDHAENLTPEILNQKLENMREHPSFSEAELREGLSSKRKVRERLSAAIQVFS